MLCVVVHVHVMCGDGLCAVMNVHVICVVIMYMLCAVISINPLMGYVQ